MAAAVESAIALGCAGHAAATQLWRRAGGQIDSMEEAMQSTELVRFWVAIFAMGHSQHLH